MVILQKDYGRVGVGVTMPRLMEGSDGKLYIVKLAGNRIGAKALANEWLGYRLGRRCGLCIPYAEQARIAPKLLVMRTNLARQSTVDEVHFAMRYLPNCEYVGRRAMQYAINKDEVVGAMLFDHLLYNEDRTLNRKNLLAVWSWRGARIYAIDHSHLLGSGRWSAESLGERVTKIEINQRLAYGWIMRHYAGYDRLMKYAERIGSIKEEEIETILREIPTAWLSDTDKEAFRRFWQTRQSMVTEIAEKIALLATDQHRRTKRHIVE